MVRQYFITKGLFKFFFFRKRHLNVLKNVLFPKIYFERDIIPTKV